MRRRELIAGLVGAVAWPREIAAQPPERTYRLGVLSPGGASYEALRGQLAKLGFIEGRNLVVDVRVGAPEHLPRIARELVATKPDVVIAVSAGLGAMKDASSTIPIVAFGPDPVAQGFAQSLSHPGGNVTGVIILAAELDSKRLQLLAEAAPGRRIAVLLHPATLSYRDSQREVSTAASQLNVAPIFFEASGPNEYAGAFAAMRAAGAAAAVISANPWFYRDRDILAALARDAGIAIACEWGDMAASGCLIGYGPRRVDLYQRVAELVARVFRGTPPSELPIEQPANFELVINVRTAREIGLSIPLSMLGRADEVIE
jgi:putative tryptophan/tyrosine transport system substrate-binding protein